MTREEFLSGKSFAVYQFGRQPYKFIPQSSEHSSDAGMITEFGVHHCNVSKVSNQGFYWYNVTLGRVAKGFIRFDNLKIETV